MYLSPPPAAVQLEIAVALDAMRLAETALEDAITAPIMQDTDTAPICPFLLRQFIAMLRFFGEVLRPAAGERLPGPAYAVRRRVAEMEASREDTPVGIDRAAFALDIAEASLVDAYEAVELVEADEDMAQVIDAIEAAHVAICAAQDRLERTLRKEPRQELN